MYKFLILRSLREIELQKAKKNQVTIYKSKLSARVSLQKGGFILVSVVLAKKKEKEVLAQGIVLKTTRDILKATKYKETKELKVLGITNQKAKQEQKK
jgi:hypothetical protein